MLATIGGFSNNVAKNAYNSRREASAANKILFGFGLLNVFTTIFQGFMSASSMPIQVRESDQITYQALVKAFKDDDDGLFDAQVCLRKPGEEGEISQKNVEARLKDLAQTINNNLGMQSSVKGSTAMIFPLALLGAILNLRAPALIGLIYGILVLNLGEMTGAAVNKAREKIPLLGKGPDEVFLRAARVADLNREDLDANKVPVIDQMDKVHPQRVARLGTLAAVPFGLGYEKAARGLSRVWNGRWAPDLKPPSLAALPNHEEAVIGSQLQVVS